MSGLWLTGMDVHGIQAYLGATGKLREIVGASGLVDHFTVTRPEHVLREMGLQRRDVTQTPAAGEDGRWYDVVRSLGGVVRLILPSRELCVQWAQLMTDEILSRAPGMRAGVAHVPFDWQTDPLGDVLMKLTAALDRKRNRPHAGAGFTGVPYTATCRLTGGPAAGTAGQGNERLSAECLAKRKAAWSEMARKLCLELDAKVHGVNRLTPTITEVVVHAPAAARGFEPGQFYRLQNYETQARTIDGTRLALEGIALTGAWKDDAQGLIGLIVLEMGVSSRLCSTLQPGEPVVLMGPTGAPTEIPSGEKVILAGGGLGNAVLFSIGRAMREAGNEVIYFGAFKRGEDIFKREEIEAAADVVIWSTDGGAEIEPDEKRPFDRHFRGNVVQAMLAYAEGEFGEVKVPLDECARLVCIGSDRMMNAVREQRFGVLEPHLMPGHVAIGSINSPMQCMMKEICAQCLCKHVDPETGEEAKPVFSCFNQDQELDRVDFDNLNQRLRQNSVPEKLSNLWLDHLAHADEELDIWTVL